MPILETAAWKELPRDWQIALWGKIFMQLADVAIDNSDAQHDDILIEALARASSFILFRDLIEDVNPQIRNNRLALKEEGEGCDHGRSRPSSGDVSSEEVCAGRP